MALPATIWWFPSLLFGGPFHFCFIVLPTPVWWSSPLLSGGPPLSCLVVLPVQAHDLPHSCLRSSSTLSYGFSTYLVILPTPNSWSSPIMPGSPAHCCLTVFPIHATPSFSCLVVSFCPHKHPPLHAQSPEELSQDLWRSSSVGFTCLNIFFFFLPSNI